MRLTPDQDLTRLNTMGLASTAALFADITTPDQIPEVVEAARGRGLALHVLGGGSNILLSDRIQGLVAFMDIRRRERTDQPDGTVRIVAGAGEVWHDLVEWSVAQGLQGLESMAGIPGSVGAAPVQNIGAYGAELCQHLVEVTAYDTVAGDWATLDREACRFAYRHSRFKDEPGRFIIASVTLSLRPPAPDARPPAEVMAEVLAQRASKLPDWRTLGNVGSFFHNPIVSADVADGISDGPRYPQADGWVKLSAGWLIEQCGFKGVRRGPAGTYDRHALVIVNHGGATRADIRALADEIKAGVKAKFGVALIQEPADW